MSDEHTVDALRRAAALAVHDRHLAPGLAAVAWSDAQASPRAAGRRVAIAASMAVVVGVATALAIWGSGEHANPPAGASACAGNVSTALLPSWAQGGFTPDGLHTPHAIGAGGQIIGVLFVNLRVHQPVGTNNKILWVARNPGSGPLLISAQLEGSSRTVTTEVPGGPGPSIINMPAPGCWQMHLTWSGQHDTIAFRYEP